MTRRRKQDVERLARKFGAELAINFPAPDLDCELLAPDGHHWRYSGVHALVGSNYGEDVPTSEIWQDLYDRAQAGVEKCTATTCNMWLDKYRVCEFWDYEEYMQ